MRNNKYNSYAFPTNQLKIHFALKIITLEVLHVDVIGRHNPRSETCYGKYPTQVRIVLASEMASCYQLGHSAGTPFSETAPLTADQHAVQYIKIPITMPSIFAVNFVASKSFHHKTEVIKLTGASGDQWSHLSKHVPNLHVHNSLL